MPVTVEPTCELIHGDCLDVLRGMDAGSVDAVVTDPPYGQTNESYDSPVAFNPAIWRECYRVARCNAALLSFAGSPTYHRIASAIEAGGWKVRQMWAWVYRDGMITSAYPKEGFDRLAPAMTPICFATKGKVLLGLEREGEPWKLWHDRPGSRLSERSRGKNPVLAAGGHWPRSLVCSEGIDGLQYFALSQNATGKATEKTGHPNQKPLALMRWLVGKLPGRTVLDPFAGSGTTGIAALAEGRNAILIEQSAEYVEIARRCIGAFEDHP